MKKTMALFLAAVLSLSLFGCGESKDKKEPKEKEQENTQEKAQAMVSEAMDNYNKAQEEQKKREEEIKDTFENKQRKIEDAEFDTIGFNGESTSTIKLKSFVVIGGKYDNNADERYLVLTFDYTNNRDGDCCFNTVGNKFETYQDGVKLDEVIGEFDKEIYTQIKSGKTIEVVNTIKLRNDTSDVEFEVGDETVYTLKIK